MEKVPFGKFGFIHRSTSDWIHENKTLVILFSVGFLSLLSWSVFHWRSGSSHDYISAEKIFNEWTGERDSKLIRLQKILKSHPELHAKYDGRVAQKLLTKSQHGLAASFAKASQKRLGILSPYYADFTNCSLLIGSGRYDEALAQTRQLKEKLIQSSEGSLLYSYTLLRIAFLELAKGNPREELAAWKEFKREAGWIKDEKPNRKIDSETLQLLCQNFQKNDVSLQDFIQHRETLLTY